eukprot:Skav201166  [mRNA]  locus=scaffold65:510107:511198:- [translate_table: standard]
MRPTNLTSTQHTACRNKAREQRVKFQEQRDIPRVPKLPLKYPLDMEIYVLLSNADLDVSEVLALLKASFQRAFQSVQAAADAYEDLCLRTQRLNNVPHAFEKVKKAKMYARDILLWKWFSLTGWIYNQAESEFFKEYGRDIESQLINSVAKIRQELMQKLMKGPTWHRLERKLVQCAAEGSWTPELEGLSNRFHWTIESLGGLGNPVLWENMLSKAEQLKQAIEEQELAEAEQEREREFEQAVHYHAGQRIVHSALDFIGLGLGSDTDLAFDDLDLDDGPGPGPRPGDDDVDFDVVDHLPWPPGLAFPSTACDEASSSSAGPRRADVPPALDPMAMMTETDRDHDPNAAASSSSATGRRYWII